MQLFNRLNADSTGKMGFTRSGATDQYKILCAIGKSIELACGLSFGINRFANTPNFSSLDINYVFDRDANVALGLGYTSSDDPENSFF